MKYLFLLTLLFGCDMGREPVRLTTSFKYTQCFKNPNNIIVRVCRKSCDWLSLSMQFAKVYNQGNGQFIYEQKHPTKDAYIVVVFHPINKARCQ